MDVNHTLPLLPLIPARPLRAVPASFGTAENTVLRPIHRDAATPFKYSGRATFLAQLIAQHDASPSMMAQVIGPGRSHPSPPHYLDVEI